MKPTRLAKADTTHTTMKIQIGSRVYELKGRVHSGIGTDRKNGFYYEEFISEWEFDNKSKVLKEEIIHTPVNVGIGAPWNAIRMTAEMRTWVFVDEKDRIFIRTVFSSVPIIEKPH